jgi:hypothetical protein
MTRLLLFVFALAAAVLPDQAAAEAPSGEDLFKWGEYDSLIRVLEPENGTEAIHSPRSPADSASRAKSFLFLGVAFYATGKVGQADEAFAQACDLDPDLKLDRFYVTDEIADHFQAIAKNGMRRRQSRQAVTAAASGPAARHQSAQGRPVLKNRDGKPWLWWSLGVTALAVAGGGALYLANQAHVPDEKVTKIDLTK